MPASREKQLHKGMLKATSGSFCTNFCFFVTIGSTAAPPVLCKAKSWVKLPDYTHRHDGAVWQVFHSQLTCALCFYHQLLWCSRWLCSHGLESNINGLFAFFPPQTQQVPCDHWNTTPPPKYYCQAQRHQEMKGTNYSSGLKHLKFIPFLFSHPHLYESIRITSLGFQHKLYFSFPCRFTLDFHQYFKATFVV